MSEKKICMHCLVKGRVQGVGFRGATKRQALRLGVSGWVRNLSDGRVEILVYGESKAVESLCAWLHKGPDFSHVSEVHCRLVDPVLSQCPEGFTVN
jgi:acylphosphatase